MSHHPMGMGKRWACCLLALSWTLMGAEEACGRTLPIQEGQTTCRVTDATTGRALPLARVSSNDGECSWTNEEGACVLPTQPDGTVLLACAGYENRTLRTGEASHEVALTPLHEDSAITGQAAEEILHKVALQMQADLKQHKRGTSDYFIRQDNELNGEGASD